MTAERKLFDSIPSDLDASWIVNYLIGNKFSPLHVPGITQQDQNRGQAALVYA